MKLTFTNGNTLTFSEVADLLEAEERVGKDAEVGKDGLRSLWGVLFNSSLNQEGHVVRARSMEHPLGSEVMESLWRYGLFPELVEGTPEQRCTEMARRWRAAD